MLARLATFSSMPADLDDPAVRLLEETVKATPGFVAGFHMHDSKSGKAISFVVLEDANAARAVAEALARRSVEDRVGVDPDQVEFFEGRAF
jgi:microcystin degradation protein MlrC